MSNYSAKIRETSFENLSAKDRIKYKQLDTARQLDELTSCESSFIIEEVKGYVLLEIHNEKADTPDYIKLLIIDSNDNKFTTGSESFIRAFGEIYTEMSGEAEPWGIEILKRESKNYKGKYFLTCNII